MHRRWANLRKSRFFAMFMGTNQHIKWAALAAAMVLSACSPKVDTHGYVNDNEWKEAVTPGKTTKQEIAERFGSPSSVSSFGDESWYYVSTRMETTAFLKPEVAKHSPTHPDNIKTGVQINAKYWLENQAAVTERFNSWVLK